MVAIRRHHNPNNPHRSQLTPTVVNSRAMDSSMADNSQAGSNMADSSPVDQYGGYQQGGYQQGGYQQGGYQQGPYGVPPGTQSPLGPTSMGMSPNVEAGLSYLFGWVTGLIFFLVEKQNRFVRFHAMQSILFFGGLTLINIILNVIGGIGIPGLGLLAALVGIVGFVGWIVLLINGFQGKYFKLPIVGDYAEKYANQGIPGM